MKAKGIFRSFLLISIIWALALPGPAAESGSIYGHISFVEGQVAVIRSEQSEHKAVVNLPLVPGDRIVTSSAGRCELQFDNGTVIRLDKDSILHITTVQAPTLTSSWKVTTLHLLQGQVYTLPQTYNQEMFQIITPNAAVRLKSRTVATIGFSAALGTTLFSDAGKFAVLYGANGQTAKKAAVKSGQAFIVNSEGVLAVNGEKRKLEFMAWNDYIDRHFKELHFGISKVPPKLKFGNSALRDWAEKWSSHFGEWIYDELFGYVWKPTGAQFVNMARPFFNADHIRINGQLFLVPQQSWAWVPAHMGTWVWLNRGWTWVPGDWFHSGIVEFLGFHTFPTMDYWHLMGYGYRLFLRYGHSSWRLDYLVQHYRELWEQIKGSWLHDAELNPGRDILPDKLEKIFKRAAKNPAADMARRLGLSPASSLSGITNLPPQNAAKPLSAIPGPSGKTVPGADLHAGRDSRHRGGNRAVRDWNPDSRWADARGYSIHYSSSRNAVICPELNISSDRDRLRQGAGAARSVSPGPGSIPGPSPTAAQGAISTESAAGNGNKDDRAEKKDDPRR